MHISKVIEKLGYKPNEVKVYLATLSLGECTVSDIAKKVHLPRTSVQMIAEKLHAEGLMNLFTKRRYTYWVAENPERFMILEKEREAALRAIMPTLSTLSQSAGGRPIVKVFNGVDEIKVILNDMIATKHNILAIIPWDEWAEMFGRDYMEDLIERRVKSFLRINLLSPKTHITEKLKEHDSQDLRITRFVSQNININDAILIYADKVAIISLNKKLPTGILIEDPNTKRTMQTFFDIVWHLSQSEMITKMSPSLF